MVDIVLVCHFLMLLWLLWLLLLLLLLYPALCILKWQRHKRGGISVIIWHPQKNSSFMFCCFSWKMPFSSVLQTQLISFWFVKPIFSIIGFVNHVAMLQLVTNKPAYNNRSGINSSQGELIKVTILSNKLSLFWDLIYFIRLSRAV